MFSAFLFHKTISMKVALQTLGCKLNYAETSSIGAQFISNGFSIVDDKECADVYVLNTCTVTSTAERECRQLVRRFRRQNPNAYIVVTGCYAQLRPDEICGINGVDAVLGSSEKFNLFSILPNFSKKDLTCVFVSPIADEKEFGKAHSSETDSRTRAYLKIQDGCDYKCTFCTIPLARGKSRSMNPDDIVSEFKQLINENYKEIILTGVNVGDYGKAFESNLYRLLLRLIEIEGEFRIRISSIEPNLLSDEIINLTVQSEKLCKHFHIPLQSGNPKILKMMQRRYSVEEYAKLIIKIKNRIPEAGIGVDVIVGFPGETEQDFVTTHNFLRDLPITYLHVFTYSERPDTKAVELDSKVDVHERRRRNSILRILSEKKRNEFYRYNIDKELSILFEHENSNGFMKGFSSNYIRVGTPFNSSLINNFTQVKINGVNNEFCIGECLVPKNAVDLLNN